MMPEDVALLIGGALIVCFAVFLTALLLGV